MIATTIPTAPETPQAPVPAVPPYAEPDPAAGPIAPWKLASATLKGRRRFWKRHREWLARVTAAWAAVPIQKIPRLEVEQLVIRPYGATGSIEIGSNGVLDDHGVGEPSLAFKDAHGHRRLEITVHGDSAAINFLAPDTPGAYPHIRAHLGICNGDVTFSAEDADGNTVFRLGAPGWALLAGGVWEPAEADTPESATHKAEMRAFVAKHNEEQRQARVDARGYWRARILSGLDMD